MKAILSILILALLATGGHEDDADANRKSPGARDTKTMDFQFDGIWKPKGAMLSGVLLPPPALKAITLEIQQGNYKVTVEGEDHSDKGTFTLDDSVTPNRMTLKSTEGPNRGKTFLAIYEITGPNAMRVCYDLSGNAFPKEFKAPKDTELYLVGYRRQTGKTSDEDQHRADPRKPVSKSKDQ